MAKTSPAEFVRQVRQEVNKVTFPTRRETLVSATLVLVMVVVMGIFFLITDNVIQFFIKLILGFGS
jgi:preprotein translocase subunit SecE